MALTRRWESLKRQAIVCNIGHFDNEIQVNDLYKLPEINKVFILAFPLKHIYYYMHNTLIRISINNFSVNSMSTVCKAYFCYTPSNPTTL